MYFSITIFIFLLLILLVSAACRRHYAIKKVCSLSCTEKNKLLNDLIEPFGYCYDPCWDIISSRNDAWQRQAGYTAVFDDAAACFNMVFDHLPVYFNHAGRTWLIEFWKGQYGINTGAETGVYCSDRLLSEDELPAAHFDAVSDRDMLPLSFCLIRKNQSLAHVSKKTWWLTAFCMGQFTKPAELTLNVSIRFPCREMMQSFLNTLCQINIPEANIRVCGGNIRFSFCGSVKSTAPLLKRLIRCWAQFWNRFYCRVYLTLTRHFTITADRLLYLYYLLPFAFRRMLNPRKSRRRKMPKI